MCTCVSLRHKVIFAKVLGTPKDPYACITNWPGAYFYGTESTFSFEFRFWIRFGYLNIFSDILILMKMYGVHAAHRTRL